ncbi:MAG: thiamine pyrophosphate-binding protein [Acidiferrobacteraceae bacterium]|nr:thiamine pyrophosphate-binding protein [Acidiferrobacteraceae bacterium]
MSDMPDSTNLQAADRTGGEDLIHALHQEGIRVIFGLPGVQLYHAVMPLLDYPDIQFITTRHEQATTYMADGYARASGDIGVSMIVPGPGLQNASAGITNAYAASSRVLVICGQIERDKIGKNIGVLHEINDQLDIVKPITKWQSRALTSQEIAPTIQEAFYQLRTGRPRPVEIEIPPDALSERVSHLDYSPQYPDTPPVDGAAIEEAAALITEAQNPVIWAGGGIHTSGASEILLRLAEYLQIPVLTTPEGKGAISDRHHLSLGTPQGRSTGESKDELRDFFYTCDVVLAIGTRFATANPTASQTVVQIDIDPEELGRNHERTLGIAGDAREVLTSLLEAIEPLTAPHQSKKTRFEALKNHRYNNPANHVEPQHAYIQALRANLPDDAILVTDMTIMAYYSRVHFATYEPRSYFTSSYSGNLGSAFPTALGVKVAQPSKIVVSVSGDGGFLFNSPELATAAQFGINVVAVVFNDGAYGNVKRDMKSLFDGKSMGVELTNPNFMKLADAYGVTGIQAKTPEEFEDALKRSIALNSPVLLEVLVPEMPSPF